ncbi:MAG: hypothetical protein AB7W16_20765 [Candidatus Obscuribacterales bacterium]
MKRTIGLWMVCLGVLAIAVLAMGFSQLVRLGAEPGEAQSYMIRDLEQYFSQKLGPPIKIKAQLLRSAPTKTFTSFPKYFAWLKIYRENKLLSEGAVSFSDLSDPSLSQDVPSISIQQYLDIRTIKLTPKLVALEFPKPLCNRIFSLAGSSITVDSVYPSVEEFREYFRKKDLEKMKEWQQKLKESRQKQKN